MIETVLVIEGFFGRVLDSAPPFEGRRWCWKAMPEGWLVLNGSGTGCARDFP